MPKYVLWDKMQEQGWLHWPITVCSPHYKKRSTVIGALRKTFTYEEYEKYRQNGQRAPSFDESNAEPMLLVSTRSDQTWPILVNRKQGLIKVLNAEDFSCVGSLKDIMPECLKPRNSAAAHTLQKSNSSKIALTKSAYEDIKDAADELSKKDPTVREQVIEARIGQGEFRKSLFLVWGRCAVTGVKNNKILIASHIKPWKYSNDQERLDQFNGFLLSPNYDTLFDSGLISFSDAGSILVSAEVNEDDLGKLGINKSCKLMSVYPENKPYLAYHRKLHSFD